MIDHQASARRFEFAEKNKTGTVAGFGKPDTGDGCDPQFGARSLKRAGQACLAGSRRRRKRILNPRSMRLLEGEFKPGHKIKVSASDGELVFQKK
ncbi:MAG: hypothetical protein ABSF60_11695 [Verrucomicrobiota bacterium]